MSEALDHVLRGTLPWRRDPPLTECGRDPEGLPVLTRTAFAAKVKAQGKQRSAMTSCITCWQTAERWHSWEEDPVSVLHRELGRVMGFRRYVRGADPARDRILDELTVMAALVEAHRDEFDTALALLGADELATVRAARANAASKGTRRG